MLILPIALALVASPGDGDGARAAVESSLAYLQEEAVDWVRTMRCASCHHAAMGVWAIREAAARGFDVDEEALAELVAYAVADPVKAKLLPESAGEPPTFALSAAYGSLAARAVGTEEAEGSRGRLGAHLVATQGEDGSWPLQAARPPMLEGPEVATLMALLAVDDVAARAKARAWLDLRPPGSLQARALRLIVAEGPAGSEATALLALQNEDGGWSQTSDRPSDAYATGMALYALAGRADGAALERARAFLVRTQEDDGSWPMTSRPMPDGGAPAKDLRPITYASTAWATLGLLRSSPASGGGGDGP